MSQSRSRTICLVALITAIPFGHLLDIGYDITNPEPWVITALFLVFSLGLARITVGNRSFGPVYALAVYWFADALIYDRGLPLALVILAVMIGFAFFMRRIEEWALPATAVFAVLFSLSAVFKEQSAALVWSGPEPTPVAKDGAAKPAILHLVLDEFMSPLAMPETVPAGHPAAHMLADLAAKGFHVNSRATSVSGHTEQSVSAVMGLTDAIDNFTTNTRASAYTYSVKNNQLFKDLRNQGYEITTIQTNFLELCADQPDMRCATYTRAANMGVFARAGVPMLTRIQLALVGMFQDYTQQKNIHRVAIYDAIATGIAGGDPSYGYFSRPLVVLEILDDIRAGVYGPQSGQAMFAHLLLPHFPYVLRPDCSLKPISEWTFPMRYGKHQQIETAYLGYWDQAACLLDRINDIVDQANDRGDMIVVMHGDHGSRITREWSSEDEDDVLMSFVATKAPGMTGAEDDAPVTLQDVTADFYRTLLEE